MAGALAQYIYKPNIPSEEYPVLDTRPLSLVVRMQLALPRIMSDIKSRRNISTGNGSYRLGRRSRFLEYGLGQQQCSNP